MQHVTEDLNFTQVPRIDRCQTCHLGIDNPDYAEAPQPFTTHPDLEIYVAPESLHPRDSFGCTSCHEGRGRATTFVGVNHTPQNEEQEHEWVAKYGWKEDHYWDKPMYPNGFAQAGCTSATRIRSCFPGPTRSTRAASSTRPRAAGVATTPTDSRTAGKWGPKLEHIVSKTTPEWAARWVKDPKSFKTSNYMPRFWNLDNNLDSEIGARNATGASVDRRLYLRQVTPLDYGSSPRATPGTARCSSRSSAVWGATSSRSPTSPRSTGIARAGRASPASAARSIASSCSTGSRTPRHYWEETFMPDLRLTDGEAADVTAYL